MPQLKGANHKPEPTCYTLETSAVGINFELVGGNQLFACYSFLSYIRLEGEENICFHYTFGELQVKGRHLLKIYDLAKQHTLGVVRSSKSDDPCRAEIEVKQIIL